MTAYINEIGTSVPNAKISQSTIATYMKQHIDFSQKESHQLDVIYRASGIDYRHSVLSDFHQTSKAQDFMKCPSEPNLNNRMKLYEIEAPVLAIQSILECMKGRDMKDLTHLITVSCTGIYAPGIDLDIIDQLKMHSNIQRTAINFMGCYGVFNALKLAKSICEASTSAQVLIVSVELCTLHFQSKNDKFLNLSQALFSDGAASCLVTNEGNYDTFSIDQFHCDVLLEGKNEMSWKIGQHAFDMILTLEVAKLIEKNTKSIVSKLLDKVPFDISQISHYALHPGGKSILKAIEFSLNLSKEQNKHAYHILKNYGNMSSATILFVLKKLLEDQSQAKGPVLSMAFGPGLTIETMILTLK
ncbi:MAG: type III polyketide synthase [Flammeovirgaceae bacterium]|nr:type III polyketide synthase [Flammeovirgaceae bacterium]|tara:strand:- start:744 stop:1817 length:1074 start_codon:yes stop_codon:yes gene_type:complete